MYCGVCCSAFPTSQSLRIHIASTHKTTPSLGAKTKVTEWYLAGSSRSPLRSEALGHSLPSPPRAKAVNRDMDSPRSYGFAESSRILQTSQTCSPQMNVLKGNDVLVIDTNPLSEPSALGGTASSPPKPQYQPKQKRLVKCPIKGCSTHLKRADKLNAHFKLKHSFTCSFEGCQYSHYSLVFFINHVKHEHRDNGYPIKRPRSLEDEADEAARGL